VSVFATTPESQKRMFPNKNAWVKSYTNYLPLEEMSDTKVYLRNTEDESHFQCGFQTYLGEADGILEYKTPANKDCRDLMNLNLVLMLVHMSRVGLHPQKSLDIIGC